MFWGRQESVERLALIFCTFLQTGEYKNFIVSGTNVVNLSPKALIFQGYRALFFLKNF